MINRNRIVGDSAEDAVSGWDFRNPGVWMQWLIAIGIAILLLIGALTSRPSKVARERHNGSAMVNAHRSPQKGISPLRPRHE